MNNQIIRLLTVLSAAFVVDTSAVAQTWQTVDDFSYGSPNTGTPAAITADGSGTVYVAGYAGNPQRVALLRRSVDGGATWQTVDVVTNSPNSGYHAVVIDPQGHVFAAGWWTDPGGLYYSLVRRSLDGGQTWQTVDNSLGGDIFGMACSVGGNLFTFGTLFPGGHNTVNTPWFFGSSQDGGLSWQSPGAPGGLGAGFGVACAGSDVYVCGRSQDTVPPTWGVYKSTDGGVSWQNTFTTNAPLSGTANAIAAQAFVRPLSGRVFVLGFTPNTNGTGSYILRQGQPGGQVWTNTDIGDYVNGTPTLALRGLTVDLGCNVYLVGTTNQNAWLVLRFQPQTGQMTVSDEFGPGSGWAITSDPFGNLYSCGLVGTAGTGLHWTVRKLAAALTQPPLLSLSCLGNSLCVSWPTAFSGFTLESSGTLDSSASWSAITTSPSTNGGDYVVTLGMTNGTQFFRLRR